jgi:HAD superfamily hydrolase (TIGR01450 family)
VKRVRPHPDLTFDTIVFDFDGTLCLNDQPIGNVICRFNSYLSKKGRRGILATNNTSHSRSHYLTKLRHLGLVGSISVVTPTIVASKYLAARSISRAYILGTVGCKSEFRKLGIMHNDQDPQCVIVAFDTELTYRKLEDCCRWISSGIPLYQTNVDLFCPIVGGRKPDCGSIQTMLTSTTGIRPVAHFGKPGKLFVSYLRREFSLTQGSVVAIGDRQATDIVLGNRLKAFSVWVKSGDQQKSSVARPDRICDTMEDFFSAYS